MDKFHLFGPDKMSTEQPISKVVMNHQPNINVSKSFFVSFFSFFFLISKNNNLKISADL